MFFPGVADRIKALGLAALLLSAAPDARSYTPGTSNPAAVSGFVVNAQDRRDVLVFYNCAYNASQNFAANSPAIARRWL